MCVKFVLPNSAIYHTLENMKGNILFALKKSHQILLSEFFVLSKYKSSDKPFIIMNDVCTIANFCNKLSMFEEAERSYRLAKDPTNEENWDVTWL